jgi:hypothetical protein
MPYPPRKRRKRKLVAVDSETGLARLRLLASAQVDQITIELDFGLTGHAAMDLPRR